LDGDARIKMTFHHPPFLSPHYVLGAGDAEEQDIQLRLTNRPEAEMLGPVLAQMDPWSRLGSNPKEMTGFLAVSHETKRSFAILANGECAGVIVVRFPWLAGPYLNLLAVLPIYQGLGIGRIAVAWLEAEAIAAGARNSFLCVSAFNAKALEFYRRAGYGETARLNDLIKDGEDEILMRKRL
jgi:ribosomal protein S18 acetylase RimI-like enzyme